MTPKADKTADDMLREIHECLCGTYEKRGLIRRVEILEWWKGVTTRSFLWLVGTAVTGFIGYIGYRVIGPQ